MLQNRASAWKTVITIGSHFNGSLSSLLNEVIKGMLNSTDSYYGCRYVRVTSLSWESFKHSDISHAGSHTLSQWKKTTRVGQTGWSGVHPKNIRRKEPETGNHIEPKQKAELMSLFKKNVITSTVGFQSVITTENGTF